MTDEGAPELVDDHYWLRRASRLIEDAVEVKKATADRLVNAVAWLATVFVLFATTFFATRLADPSRAVIVVCSLTALLVIAAYLVAVHAASPTYVAFDPRVPAEIESSYSLLATSAQTRIRLASGTTVAAAVGVMVSLLVLIASHSSTSTSPQLRATLASAHQPLVIIDGSGLVSDRTIALSVVSDKGPTKSTTVRADVQGDFTADIAVSAASSYRVRASWTTSDGAVVTIETAVT